MTEANRIADGTLDAGQTLWLCEYCDRAPYHSERLLQRHLDAKHTEDGIALFNRDLTFRQLVRKATRIAKVVAVVTGFKIGEPLTSGLGYDGDAWHACYDSLIDLLLAGQPITNRNIRRGAYRALMNDHETSLDEMMLDGENADDNDMYVGSKAYAAPDTIYGLTESMLEIATGKYAIESPMLYVAVEAEPTPTAIVLTGYDALLANCEDALEATQNVAKAANVSDKARKGYEARMRTLTARKG